MSRTVRTIRAAGSAGPKTPRAGALAVVLLTIGLMMLAAEAFAEIEWDQRARDLLHIVLGLPLALVFFFAWRHARGRDGAARPVLPPDVVEPGA